MKWLNKIKNGAIIETKSEEGLNKLLNNEALQKSGMEVGMPIRKAPVIMIYDVKA